MIVFRDPKECSNTELMVIRTNLSKFYALATVREYLMRIQKELDERDERTPGKRDA